MTATLSPEPNILAVVGGKPYTELPNDLFIPPDALEILLDSFSGPLDLLLYLIRKQNIDILDIPIALITKQYMQYIVLVEERRLELAADYLVMAAMLAEIKSKLLLPIEASNEDEEDEDPRMALVRRLQLYEQFKQAALLIDSLPRLERDMFQVKVKVDDALGEKKQPDIALPSLTEAMRNLLIKQQHLAHHHIMAEPMSVRERMVTILELLQHKKLVAFSMLFTHQEGRMGLVVSLLAVLELARQSLVTITQSSAFTPIHLKTAYE